jgi:putative membrane protein
MIPVSVSRTANPTMQTPTRRTPDDATQTPLPLLAVRGGIGGVLMGLANLVPGISGGTMLLAAGVYPKFINAIGEVTTLKFRKASLLLLTSVIGAALLAIVLLAGPVKDLVVHHRWIMYSLFIGLTLGGVPVVMRLIGPRPLKNAGVWIAALFGFIAMGVLAYFQMQGGGGAEHAGFLMMFCAGVAGASAMILPGVSGGYLLLVLGVYVPILTGISMAKDAAKAGDIQALMGPALQVVLPVGLGVLVGVVVVSNVLRLLLRKCEKPTLGVLLGLLLGAVVGLWPFQQGVAPEVGSTLKGQTVLVSPEGDLMFDESGKPVEPDDYPTEVFEPNVMQSGASVGLIIAGFFVTLLVDKVGGGKNSATEEKEDKTPGQDGRAI